MPHADSALAGIAAAGNDPEALAEAIEQASFLDATPGEDRQKLRGKRCKFFGCFTPILKVDSHLLTLT